MSTVEELHEKTRVLWYELNDAVNECFQAMSEMHEETVAASPYDEEYAKAQDELLEAQRNHDNMDIIMTLHRRFMDINDKAVTTSPLYSDYKKAVTTDKMLKQALGYIGDASSVLGELESVGKNWVGSKNTE